MQPKLSLLTEELIQRILDEAFQLMLKPGIKVQNAEARDLLASAGAQVDEESFVVRIPEQIVNRALETVPHQFHLYDYEGNPKVQYGGDAVHFDPGSSGITILDPETLEHKNSTTPDLINILKITEQIPQYDAQSTALVCTEVHRDIQDLYRLYLVLLYSRKPIVTGAFTNQTIHHMIEMLAIFAGGKDALCQKPRADLRCLPIPSAHLEQFRCGQPY